MTDPRTVDRLKDSEKRWGQIHAIIEAADGDVISGEHRLKARPDWRRERRNDISEPFEKIAFRFAANEQRQMSAKEKTQLIEAAHKHYTAKHGPVTMTAFARALGVGVITVERYAKHLFDGTRPEGVIRLPEGTLTTHPRYHREDRGELIDSVISIPLKVLKSSASLYVVIPKVLALKYGIQENDRLIVSCRRSDRFTVRRGVGPGPSDPSLLSRAESKQRRTD